MSQELIALVWQPPCRLAEQFIDNAVDEISLELVDFCDSVVEQMSAAELMAV